MAFHQPKHSLIIKVYFQKLMNKLLERSNNYTRENHRRILQSKWHYSVLKTTPLNREVHLSPILWRDFDLMVPKEPINEIYASWPPTLSNTSSVNRVGKGSCTQASFKLLFDIHAYPLFILLLLLLYHHWSYPVKLFHKLNDAYSEHLV